MFGSGTMRLIFSISMVYSVLLVIVHNTEAVRTSCPLGHYATLNANGNEVLACHRCRSCPPGLGVVRNCTATENTVCEVCDIGTFSSTGSRVESCKPCRQCPTEDTLEECNPTSDTRCKKQCDQGFYYDPETDKCTQCSYCFPDNINAQTVRVEDCLKQSLPTDYQCSPLPSSQASNSWSPPAMVAVNDRRLMRQPPHRGSRPHLRVEMGNRDRGQMASDRENRRGGPRHGRVDDDIVNELGHDVGPTKSLSTATTTFTKREVLHSSPASLLPEGGPYISIDVGEHPEAGEHSKTGEHLKTGEHPKTAGQQSPLLYGTFTPAQLKWMIAIIAVVSGLVSFLVTTFVCCCLMKRGKFVGPKVNSVKTQKPAKAWHYQDLMPNATEEISLVETPQQKRKVTCV
ncbi:uncharacterized protein [Diadema antillarum]|uniref:uncharacterized protein n=1 Tax=Diadema antillarum TaxID=105358 RepID=UPI003A89956A